MTNCPTCKAEIELIGRGEIDCPNCGVFFYFPLLANFTDRQKELARVLRSHRYVLYGGARGGGKAEPVSEPVATPYGFRPIGELAAGDTILAWDGSWTRVIAVHPQGAQRILKVSFTDGTWTRATADHLWRYWIMGRSSRRHGERAKRHLIATKNIAINRKMLAQLAEHEPETFEKIVEKVRS